MKKKRVVSTQNVRQSWKASHDIMTTAVKAAEATVTTTTAKASCNKMAVKISRDQTWRQATTATSSKSFQLKAIISRSELSRM